MKVRSVSEKLDISQFLQCRYENTGYRFIFHHADVLCPDPGARIVFPEPLWGYEILYCCRGRNVLTTGRTPMPFCPGQIAAFSRGQSLRLQVSPRGSAEIFSLRFTMESAMADQVLPLSFCRFLELWAAEPLAEQSLPVTLSEANAKRYEYLFNRLLAQLLPGGRLRWFDFKDAIYRILAFMAREVFLSDNTEDIDSNPLHRVRHVIETQYAEALNLDELAQLAGKSKTQLCRSFRQYFGTTPIDYQIQMRMEQAKRILADTRIPIKGISAMIGFTSPYHFSRQFCKRCGMSPSLWRQSIHR